MVDTSSVFLTPPDEPVIDYSRFNHRSCQTQTFTQHSDSGYEGVYSQNWYRRADNDPEWKKLNRLKEELFDLDILEDESTNYKKEKAKKKESREQVISTIKWLLWYFKETKKPIGMLTRGKWANVDFDLESGVRLKTTTVRHTMIGVDKRARMLSLLCRVYLNLKSNRYSTKRELYYRDKTQYLKQTICDALIEDLCCVTYYSRKQLHIFSCPKGLIYGRLKVKINDILYNCMDYPRGLTISPDIDEIEDVQSDAKFILVIEKDASFQHLITCRVVDKFPAILITGRGFPDADTRRFTKYLVEKLKIPLLGLADANPWGLEIMCIYRYGSVAMAHEANNCVVTKMRWLGLLPSDLVRFKITEDQMEKLNESDKAKIASLKRRPYILQNSLWAAELNLMVENNRKAELQAIENFVEVYLPTKIKHGSWF